MDDIAGDKFSQKQKKTAIETFIGSLMPSARMMSLYQPGHAMADQISERIKNILIKTLGQETTLVVDVKGKTASVGDMTLQETKDITLFGATLHTLGIGQVLFTNRIANDGMKEFMRILVMKPDDKHTLTDIQKTIQSIRIDGLQITIVLSFVETGETKEESQKPGELSEEQITAFIQAKNLPDFLLLLLKQNELLSGKEAESISILLDNTLYRDMSMEQFQEAMPWKYYDTRIRECWNSFVQKQSWQPKPRKGAGNGGNQRVRQGWERNLLISQTSLFQNIDLSALKNRNTLEKADAIQYCLRDLASKMDTPTANAQSDLSLNAYIRLLAELGQDGNIESLLSEFELWQNPLPNGQPKPQFNAIVQELRKRVLSPLLVENTISYMRSFEKDSKELARIEKFLPHLGAEALPMFIDALRNIPDQPNRLKLCSLLTKTCQKLGNVEPLVAALKDKDWIVVRYVATILADTKVPEASSKLMPHLSHPHEKVRQEVIRLLGNIGDDTAVNGLSSFILKSTKYDEVSIAITNLSLLIRPGIDAKLINAFNRVDHYDTKVHIVTVLSRVNTNESLNFLKTAAKRSWYEIITGRNKSLSKAARESIGQFKT